MKALLVSSGFRDLFEVARRYVSGASSIQELNGAVSRAQSSVKSSGASAEVCDLLDEWSRMVNRRWNEWGLEKSPLSEAEFLAWLREQLVSVEG